MGGPDPGGENTVKQYFYLATVYTKHPQGLEVAFQEACKVAAKFMKMGIKVFCPIAHSHPIALYGGLSQTEHSFWMEQDRPLMDHACGLLVVRMKGWEQSEGIRQEIETFKKAGKTIIFTDP